MTRHVVYQKKGLGLNIMIMVIVVGWWDDIVFIVFIEYHIKVD